MKTKNSKLQKWITMSLLVIYVFVAFMYIFTLPQLNHVDINKNALSRIESLTKNNNSGTAESFLHRGIRSTIDNKQKVIIPATTACILFLAFIFATFGLLSTTSKNNTYPSAFFVTQPATYLSLRTLRI